MAEEDKPISNKARWLSWASTLVILTGLGVLIAAPDFIFIGHLSVERSLLSNTIVALGLALNAINIYLVARVVHKESKWIYFNILILLILVYILGKDWYRLLA